jgi:hypothetical protein
MMRTIPLVAVALFGAISIHAAPMRRSVVMGLGETTVVTTKSSIATVTTPPGSPAVVAWTPEQYGNNISLKALKKGEVKLLVESTESRITEIVNVIVADKKVADRYRFIAGSLAGIEGLQPSDITLGDNAVVVGGTVYSLKDLQRCRAIDTSTAKASAKVPATLCVARLSSAVPAVRQELGYMPAASVSFAETPLPAAAGSTEGAEGNSTWSATIRVGDVPVMELSSANRADLFVRAARLAAKVNLLAAEWSTAAQKGTPYPTTFNYYGTATGYDLTAQWKYTQGTRGESLIRLTPDDLLQATMRSGGGVERMIQWWAALMQDAFRMYYMAALPAKSSVGTDPLLRKTYQHAVTLTGTQLDRATSATAIARAIAAERWSEGHDPFEGLLTTIPAEFQPAPVAR